MGEHSRKSKRRSKVSLPKLAAVVVLLAICAGLLYGFINRDTLFSGMTAREDEAFTYEAGSGQTFAVVENGLAVASSTGIQLFDEAGQSVVRKIFAMTTPAVAAGGNRAAFFDVGGTALRVADLDGSYTVLDTEHAILSVTVSEEGYLAVCTEETGYKGLVTIYDSDFSPVYRWYSGEGYLLKAAMSPDHSGFAALTLAASGGRIQFFSLREETPVSQYEAADTLLLDFAWCGGSRVCAISSQALLFISDRGELKNSYDFSGNTLVNYDLGDGSFVALCLSQYRAGGESQLVTLDDGGMIASQTTPRDLVGMDVRGRRLLLHFADGLVISDRQLALRDNDAETLGIRQALLRDRGDVLLLYAYYAELFS